METIIMSKGIPDNNISRSVFLRVGPTTY
jgi:hypothetical protein